MAKAEILTIGTEILLGEIVDTNSRHIARALRDAGIDLFWTSTVGDNPERIAEAIRAGLDRSEIIITTGGLGPTVDDPTREAVAMAFGVKTVFKEELWQQVIDRFTRFGRTPTENNKRQAYIPEGASAIENPVGTAPAFMMETDTQVVISLPGVPREMENLLKHMVLPYLRERYKLSGLIKARVLRTAGVGESVIDEKISDLEEGYNPTVGLAAHAGSVDVRITAKAQSEEEADQLIGPVEAELRKRLGDWIYGADKDTLEDAALQNMSARGWKLAVVESGLGGRLTQRLANAEGPFLGGNVLAGHPSTEDLEVICKGYGLERGADACIGVALKKGEVKQELTFVIHTPVRQRTTERSFGGPPLMAPLWAVNSSLDLIRRLKVDGE